MKFFLSLMIVLAVSPLCAQDNYSFLSDRRFFEPEDLVGYQFVPQKMEIPKETKANLEVGEVSFGITSKNLYVKGEGITGVYNINNINSTDYGYKLALMNARNPASQGHLKVILTKGAYVDALVFKKDVEEQEIIYILPEISEEGKRAEKEFFTDWGEIEIEFPEDIWGKQIRPFIRIHPSPKTQERLYASDSVLISFEHIITEIDKSKPGKITVEESNEPVAAVEVVDEVVEETVEKVEEVAPAPKVEEESSDSPFFSSPKPKKEEVSENDSPFFSSPKPKKTEESNDSPFFSSPKAEVQVVEEVIEEDVEAVELEEDSDAIPPIGEEEIQEDLARKRKSKLKIEEAFQIKIKSLLQYDDGTEEIKEFILPIKKWVERADETARPGEEKFQIEFLGEKGKVCYLYLTTERKVSSFEWNGQKLLVRD